MGTPSFVGTLTVAERLANQNVLWKSICKRVSYNLRVGLPGIIKSFDPNTQLCTVQLAISENVIINELVQSMPIPALHDVLLMLPGDSNWFITFPSLVGSECLVMFADMCISAWSTNGGVQNQEVTRRHNLSDGFVIPGARSQPNVITDYSTTAMEIRSKDNTVKIALAEAGITFTSPLLSWNQTPTPGTTASTMSVPITLNGIVYYLRLSTAP